MYRLKPTDTRKWSCFSPRDNSPFVLTVINSQSVVLRNDTLFYVIHYSTNRSIGYSCSVRFCMQRYSVRSIAKYRYR